MSSAVILTNLVMLHVILDVFLNILDLQREHVQCTSGDCNGIDDNEADLLNGDLVTSQPALDSA